MSTKSRFAVSVLIFMLTLALMSSSLGNRSFYTRGEAREGLVVSAMLRERNFVLPLREGIRIPSKPPMFHWIAAATASATGSLSEFSIRFPSAVAGAGTAAIAFFVFSAASSVAVGITTSLVLLTTFEFARSASHARVDMCFGFFLLLVFAGLVRLFKLAEPQASFESASMTKTGALLSSGVLALGIAGAVLTKGPAGLLFPAVAAGAYAIVRFRKDLPALRQRGVLGAALWIVSAFAGGALLAGIWYLAAYQQNGSAFVYKQLLQENFNRLVEVDDASPGHKKPFYFAPLYLFTGFLPWSLLIPVLAAAYAAAHSKARAEDNRQETAAPSAAAPETVLFSVIWIVMLLAVVAVSRSKRTVYLLPCYPQLAFLTVYGLFSLAKRSSVSSAVRAYSMLIGAVVAALLATLVVADIPALSDPLLSKFVFDEPMQDQIHHMAAALRASRLETWLLVLGAAAAAASALFTKSLQRPNRIGRRICLNAAAILLILTGANRVVLPSIADQGDPRQFVAQALNAVPAGDPIFQLGSDFYAAAFYAEQQSNRPLRQFDSIDELAGLGSAFVVLDENDIAQIASDRFQIETLVTSDTFAANGRRRLLLARITDVGEPHGPLAELRAAQAIDPEPVDAGPAAPDPDHS